MAVLCYVACRNGKLKETRKKRETDGQTERSERQENQRPRQSERLLECYS